MLSYAAFVFAYLPSPSRLLTVMDPLLPMGILLRCLSAYAGQGPSDPSSPQSSQPHNRPKKTLQAPFLLGLINISNEMQPISRLNYSNMKLEDHRVLMRTRRLPPAADASDR